MNRIVVKVGTGVLLDAAGNLSQEKFDLIAKEIATLTLWGIEIVLVSSGAIKAGRERIRKMILSLNIGKKEFASIGARHLLNYWGDAFAHHRCEVAQIWLTHANLQNVHERAGVASSILTLVNTNRIIPLVNENDVVSDKEIVLMDEGISENDMLARLVAEMIGADGVLFLTEIGGVFDKDPRHDASARKYRQVSNELLASLPETSHASEYGTGGIDAKLKQAFACFDLGMHVAIAGLEENVIGDFIKGESKGTTIGKTSTFWL